MSMLSTLSDLSRRTSCVSAVSSLQLEPPLRRQSATATPPPPCRQSTAGGTPANSTLVQRRPQQHQLQVYLGPKIVLFKFVFFLFWEIIVLLMLKNMFFGVCVSPDSIGVRNSESILYNLEKSFSKNQHFFVKNFPPSPVFCVKFENIICAKDSSELCFFL